MLKLRSMSEHIFRHEYRTDVVTRPVKLGEFTVAQLNAVVDCQDDQEVRYLDQLRAAEQAAHGTQVVFANHNGHLSEEAHARNAAIREQSPYGGQHDRITLAVIALRPVNL